jgi:hypothetical protein
VRQDTQHQESQATQTYWKICKEIQKSGMSLEALSLSNNAMLEVASVVKQLSESVSEKDKIMVVTKNGT